MTNEAPRDLFRSYGYLQADLDPFGRLEPFVHEGMKNLDHDESERWRRIYCGSIGAEFMHMVDAERCRWMAEAMEATEGSPVPPAAFVLRRLAQAELLERFLHRHYVGTKRYSLEGSAALIPLLDVVLEQAARAGARKVLIGMSHRGRLNVMVRIVGRPVGDLFAHFEDGDPRSVLGSGDVRYHLGATGRYRTRDGEALDLHLVSNPSHLEAVDPVLMGRARAYQTRHGGSDALDVVLPLLIHGDAAFSGQGIAAETLNLGGVPGFDVGGVVHIVVNNLIGFTTPPRFLHGSRYATDIAKRCGIPILHVNGSEPDAVIRAAGLAASYRARFHSDVVIDLIGFRRYGHSEIDDPTMTQPRLYRAIEETPPLYVSYAEKVGVDETERKEIEKEISEELTRARDENRDAETVPVFRELPDYWSAYRGGPHDPSDRPDTAVPLDRLRSIGTALTKLPEGFNPHPKVEKLLAARRGMLRGEKPVDWGAAEALAFGTLLLEGTRVRLSGQDTRRGTFNHRHSVLIDTETEDEYVPLSHLDDDQAPFEVRDTALTEAASLGFEHGYSRDMPDALVCWEAQFGDFANGAQVIIDEFITSGEDKWGLLSGLVLLLPHGYEGQGPDHSSARLERFLQLAAEDNVQICQPSTAGQYFHLLRRQVLSRWRKPLIVMTPKSLLRSGAAATPLERIAGGAFEEVIPDEGADDPGRLLIASGKIVHDLRAERDRRGTGEAIISIDQLYPFPEKRLSDILVEHEDVEPIVWVQEEPANMGALAYIKPRLERLCAGRSVTSVRRSESASPATGSAAAHALEHRTLLALAFGDGD